MKQFQHLLP